MAKLGEGDPRWLVEDRADGANVNNWHWTEKNCMAWSKARIAELVTGIEADMSSMEGSAKITGLKELTGEAVVTTRKGNKKFAHFELTVTLSWEGEAVGEDGAEEVKGDIKVAEFATDNDEDEFVLTSTVEGKSTAAKKRVKESVLSVRKPLFGKLFQYAKELSDQA